MPSNCEPQIAKFLLYLDQEFTPVETKSCKSLDISTVSYKLVAEYPMELDANCYGVL